MCYFISGVTYIKFAKTSEAATAMEEMNGRCIAGHPRPLKVLIAHRYVFDYIGISEITINFYYNNLFKDV